MVKKKNQFDFLKQDFSFEKESLKGPRKNRDSWSPFFYFTLIASIIVGFMSLYFLTSAMPQQENLFTKFLKANMMINWNVKHLTNFAYCCVLLFIISLLSMLVKLGRYKRVSDHFDYFNLLTAFYALAGLGFYWMVI